MEWNLVGITKKLGLYLIAAILVSLSLPSHIVLANGTTVEVNLGKTIVLNVGETKSNIPLDVRGIVVSGNATGLAAFDFTLSWNPAVIRVDSITGTAAAILRGLEPTIGTINNVTGRVTLIGVTTGGDTGYSKADLTIAHMGITAVGNAGDSTSIAVTITDLADNDLKTIPALPVNAPVQISGERLLSIAVTPTNPSIATGLTQQFTATGTYTLGTANITGAVTWASHNPSVATIDATGLATSLAAGTTTITATLYMIEGTTTLTVTEAEVEVEKIVIPETEAEPGITNVSDSPGKNGTFTEEAAAESENNKVGTAIDEGTSKVEAPLLKPINWGFLGGIVAGVVVIGGVIWLVFRRRIA